ncbi:methyltransferase [Nocardioides sp. GY 10127]|uniref:class I SAM-dependent RNA methyltransferase n=1 Tax=Nocardioides sp. GY 10127 TaxID=2569762 RepID=UPI0010A939BC|nr:methyltransferase [Nocardioides sp. GY 10127]TIC86627.1 class I SAM-dependent RNA methyltransferase [Nocardioides sp. GY 10127]
MAQRENGSPRGRGRPGARTSGGRPNRARKARGASRVGTRIEGVVGPVAHGGFCVLRPEEGPVLFVRHALPGERVVAEVTEGADGDRFWRADAVEVLEPSSDRVEPPCAVAGPGGCGGCDLQHVSLPAQRAWKTAVVREQLRRIAGLEDGVAATVQVEAVPVPGRPDDGLRWRTRQRYVDLGEGRTGMRKHRSHEVVEVDDCLIDAHAGSDHVVDGTAFSVAEDGFWQVHPAAPDTLVSAVLEALAPQPGESVLDLYAGVGLFGRFLGEAVGEQGSVSLVEGHPGASSHSVRNLADSPASVHVQAGDVATVLAGRFAAGHVDLVVLDPPREGAKRAVVEQVVARTPRAVAHVACDPAALARDVALFAEHGYRLVALRAFDLFPMTHHVECVALLEKS